MSKMVGKEKKDVCGDLNVGFDELRVIGRVGSIGDGIGKSVFGGLIMKGGLINEWKDIPMELLLQILSLDDDRMVIIASGVCLGWRDSIRLGLTTLSLTRCTKNMNNLVLNLAPKFTKLQTLILRQDKQPQLEDNGVEAIAKYCGDLQNLDLSKSFKLTDDSLRALARGCQNLTKLNISGCSAFSDVAIEYLVGFCRKLKSLNLCGCGKGASDRALQAIGRYCNEMQCLNLGWCDNVTDIGVLSLANGCPDLMNLDLCGCILITDDSVVALASKCPRLRSLDLYYCQNITDRAMYSLAQSQNKPAEAITWESAKRRNNDDVDDEDDEEGLRNLNISQCTALTPAAVQAVCNTFQGLHTCYGRHSLNMSGCLNLTSVHCLCAVQAHRSQYST